MKKSKRNITKRTKSGSEYAKYTVYAQYYGVEVKDRNSYITAKAGLKARKLANDPLAIAEAQLTNHSRKQVDNALSNITDEQWDRYFRDNGITSIEKNRANFIKYKVYDYWDSLQADLNQRLLDQGITDSYERAHIIAVELYGSPD